MAECVEGEAGNAYLFATPIQKFLSSGQVLTLLGRSAKNNRWRFYSYLSEDLSLPDFVELEQVDRLWVYADDPMPRLAFWRPHLIH